MRLAQAEKEFAKQELYSENLEEKVGISKSSST
jgi:hypothetical protein